MPARAIINKGDRFGRLTVVKELDRVRRPDGSGYYRIFSLVCDCGNTTSTTLNLLRRGDTRSCGCLHSEIVAEQSRRRHTTHGSSGSREYIIWAGMKKRCTNPRSSNYKNYGGRGITVCRRWDSFENFLADMGESPPGASLDRIDNDKGYSPGNCRWASRSEQASNKRNSRYLTMGGETATLAEWSRLTGLKEGIIRTRIDRLGWPVEIALAEGWLW